MMKKLLMLFILILMSAPIFSSSEIKKTLNFIPVEEEIQRADSGTFVIFDVDDVLITRTDQILQPAYKKYNNQLVKDILNRYSPKVAEEFWSIVMLSASDKLVDPIIISLIQDLESRRIKTLALTNVLTGSLGRIPSLEVWRIQNLEKYNIHFINFWKNLQPKVFDNLELKEPKEPKESKRYPTFKEGILFSAGIPKGEILKEFLKYVNSKPKKIIFIDDKKINLDSVKSFCDSENIEFVGFEYLAINKKSDQPLNERRAKFQFEVLEKQKKWLSDQEADEALKVK